mgnify:CR=1 FL=1
MPFDFFQNAMYLAMLEEAESGKAGTQPVKEYSSNRPKKSECFASAFLFSDFFGMFPCLKKSRGSGQSPVFITAINFVIFEKLLSRDFTSLTFVSFIISIHAAHGMGVVGFHARDIVLRRCEVVPALGEAVSTNTDATHFAACRGSITVEGCHFCGHGDDAINVHAYYHTITAAEGDSCSLELRAPTGTHTQKADRFFPGDRIELIDPATLAVLERFTVKRFIALPNNHSKVGLDRPLPPMSTGKLLVNIDQLPALFFRHNLVTDHMGRSVLAKTRHVRIEANTFARSTGTAIQIAGEAEWAEGATAEDVLIRHNRILYCGRIAPRLWGVWRETGGIAVNLSAADSHAVAHRRIRIEENWIDCPQITHAVYAGNTDGMTVRRNMLHSKEAPLVCADCRKLCVEDNLEKTPP